MATSDSKNRFDTDVVRDLNSLIPKKRKRNILGQGKIKADVAQQTSFAPNAASTAEGSGVGIASPLTELEGVIDGIDKTRTYHATDQVITSSDGFFTLVFNNVETINFKDSQLADVVINYADIDPNA
ncbi:MAG: hypothetical protein HOG49_21580 [Candidatus Scalindua sp.]|jgi:hypothetical protein|nr:hypothetical protein [Candidatus Scalindua sp.]